MKSRKENTKVKEREKIKWKIQSCAQTVDSEGDGEEVESRRK